jgi:hypothetical protein
MVLLQKRAQPDRRPDRSSHSRHFRGLRQPRIRAREGSQIRARKLDDTPYRGATVVIGSAQTSSYSFSRLTDIGANRTAEPRVILPLLRTVTAHPLVILRVYHQARRPL